jgi:hypothetical protein
VSVEIGAKQRQSSPQYPDFEPPDDTLSQADEAQSDRTGLEVAKGSETGSSKGSGGNARGSMFAALVSRNYRIYLTGSFVSNIGTWMQRVAQDWLVLELSGGSAGAVGITTGLQFLPMLLLSPVAGLVADRFDKRRILKITQLAGTLRGDSWRTRDHRYRCDLACLPAGVALRDRHCLR